MVARVENSAEITTKTRLAENMQRYAAAHNISCSWIPETYILTCGAKGVHGSFAACNKVSNEIETLMPPGIDHAWGMKLFERSHALWNLDPKSIVQTNVTHPQTVTESRLVRMMSIRRPMTVKEFRWAHMNSIMMSKPDPPDVAIDRLAASSNTCWTGRPNLESDQLTLCCLTS